MSKVAVDCMFACLMHPSFPRCCCLLSAVLTQRCFDVFVRRRHRRARVSPIKP